MLTAAVRAAFVGFVGLALAGCEEKTVCSQRTATQTPCPRQQVSTMFVHTVFFDLKAGTPEAEADNMIADAYQILAKIPSVRMIVSGRRDVRMQQDVHDKTFTVGLVVYFDDKAGHDLYDQHELHLKYIERHKVHWAKARVFDFTASEGKRS